MNCYKTYIAMALAILGVQSQTTYARGGSNGGGGDEVEQSFAATANAMISALEAKDRTKSYPSGLPSLAELRSVVASTQIESTSDALFVDGVQKTAMNFPDERRVRVNRSRWKSIPNEMMKVSLALHEFLGILRKDDRNYQLSSRIRWGRASYSSTAFEEKSYS